jgi:hypothetical protein
MYISHEPYPLFDMKMLEAKLVAKHVNSSFSCKVEQKPLTMNCHISIVRPF